MAWISVHEDVVGPKLRKLSNEIGCSQAEALGILNVIWLWGLKNADQSGELKDTGRRNVAAAIPFDMLREDLNPLKIVDALIETGWIDEVDGTLFLHDWDEWQEQWYKFLGRRAYDAKRKREERRRKREDPPAVPSVPAPQPEKEPEEPGKGEEPKPKKRTKAPKPEKVKYAKFVSLQETEYQKLVERFGEAATAKAIEMLDNYKGSNGKKYDSDYRAILNWTMDRVREKCPGLIKRQEDTSAGDKNPFGEWGVKNV